jgi:hypothetical protein
VFTNGPPNNFIDEELMTFDEVEDSPAPQPHAEQNIKPELIDRTEPHEEEAEQQLETEQDEQHAESEIAEHNGPYAPNDLVLDTGYISPAISETLSTFSDDKANDNSAATTPDTPTPEVPSNEETVKKSSQPLPANGGLALGYTQAQLDEVKAFNSGLTKGKGTC